MNLFGRSALVAGVSLMVTACGRKGPLIYPDMMVLAAPAAVTGQQSGSVVKIQCALPDKDRAGHPAKDLTGVRISRKTDSSDQKNVCRACTADYTPLRTVYLASLPVTAQRFGNRLIVLDSDVSAENTYSYRIVPFTADGVDGASSAIVSVRMATPLPAPEIKVETFPTEIKLQFTLQSLRAGKLIGYNLYRSYMAARQSFQPLNREPLKSGEYVDSVLERGVTYRYSARALIMPASGDVVESSESPAVEGKLKDDE